MPEYLTAALPTLEQIKEQLGISGAESDAAITALLASTIAMVETYLGRGIKYMANAVEEFDPPDSRGPGLFVFRFPVEQVISITQEGADLTGWRVFKADGEVRLRNFCCGDWRGRACRQDVLIVVNYAGGYPDDAWPTDLVAAVMRVFYDRWAATGNTGNTSSMEAAGANRSVSIDGLTITRESLASNALGELAIPPELLAVAAALDPYRARRGTGV